MTIRWKRLLIYSGCVLLVLGALAIYLFATGKYWTIDVWSMKYPDGIRTVKFRPARVGGFDLFTPSYTSALHDDSRQSVALSLVQNLKTTDEVNDMRYWEAAYLPGMPPNLRWNVIIQDGSTTGVMCSATFDEDGKQTEHRITPFMVRAK